MPTTISQRHSHVVHYVSAKFYDLPQSPVKSYVFQKTFQILSLPSRTLCDNLNFLSVQMALSLHLYFTTTQSHDYLVLSLDIDLLKSKDVGTHRTRHTAGLAFGVYSLHI